MAGCKHDLGKVCVACWHPYRQLGNRRSVATGMTPARRNHGGLLSKPKPDARPLIRAALRALRTGDKTAATDLLRRAQEVIA